MANRKKSMIRNGKQKEIILPKIFLSTINIILYIYIHTHTWPKGCSDSSIFKSGKNTLFWTLKMAFTIHGNIPPGISKDASLPSIIYSQRLISEENIFPC